MGKRNYRLLSTNAPPHHPGDELTDHLENKVFFPSGKTLGCFLFQHEMGENTTTDPSKETQVNKASTCMFNVL